MEKKKNETNMRNLVLDTSGGEMPDPKAKSKVPSKKEIIAVLASKKATTKATSKNTRKI